MNEYMYSVPGSILVQFYSYQATAAVVLWLAEPGALKQIMPRKVHRSFNVSGRA